MSADVSLDTTRIDSQFTASRELCAVLANARRRAIIAIVRDRWRPISPTDLATELAAAEAEIPLVDVSAEQHDAVYASLIHHHLPKLADHDMIEWDHDQDIITLTPDAPVPPDRLAVRLDARSARQLDRLFTVLANTRRRTVLSVLAQGPETVDVAELARLVTAAETGCQPTGVAESECDHVRVSLHHSHLPSMAAADLLEYDTDAGVVHYHGHPLLID